MISEEVDSTAWWYSIEVNLSIIDETFTDSPLLAPSGRPPLGTWIHCWHLCTRLWISQTTWLSTICGKCKAWSIFHSTEIPWSTSHRSKLQSWKLVYVDFVDWSNTWSKQDAHEQRISLKERPAECSYGSPKAHISEVMSGHSLSFLMRRFASASMGLFMFLVFFPLTCLFFVIRIPSHNTLHCAQLSLVHKNFPWRTLQLFLRFRACGWLLGHNPCSHPRTVSNFFWKLDTGYGLHWVLWAWCRTNIFPHVQRIIRLFPIHPVLLTTKLVMYWQQICVSSTMQKVSLCVLHRLFVDCLASIIFFLVDSRLSSWLNFIWFFLLRVSVFNGRIRRWHACRSCGSENVFAVLNVTSQSLKFRVEEAMSTLRQTFEHSNQRVFPHDWERTTCQAETPQLPDRSSWGPRRDGHDLCRLPWVQALFDTASVLDFPVVPLLCEDIWRSASQPKLQWLARTEYSVYSWIHQGNLQGCRHLVARTTRVGGMQELTL